MQEFELTILGCSSAIPTSKRNPSAQLLQASGHFFLIDCGEATQIQLRKYKIKFQRIDHIFISHLHGDHYWGLVGLLSSMHLLGRTNDLHIYAPPPLKEIIGIQHMYSDTRLNYQIIYHDLTYDRSKLIYDCEQLTVETILLNHRIPCCGFLFREKRKGRSINKEKLKQYKFSIAEIAKLKQGLDAVTEDGIQVKNEELTTQAPLPRSFAYCSDTSYYEPIVEQVRGADLLYHEATFMHNMLPRAKETLHSTTVEAATIAKMAAVKKLVIGHYSARYSDLQPLLQEARAVFDNTELSMEGVKFSIGL